MKKSLVWAGLLSTALAVACGPSRSQPDGGKDSGCVGVCGGGAGGGGGGGGGTGGGDTDGGTDGGRVVTIAQAKQATFCTDLIKLENVVVVAIDNSRRGDAGDYDVQFWVVDPNNPTNGIYVDKFYTDLPGPYDPQIGDVLDIEGYLGTQSRFEDRIGYRLTLKSQFGCQGQSSGKLVITRKGTMTPPSDNLVSAGFGNADGGWGRPNRELAGTRVHIPGPLVLTDPNPPAFKRISAVPGDNVHFGFEVTGGILVNNYKTFGTSPTDGGAPRCDWRRIANDGGTVTFPNGIRGVWDSYTHAPCLDGGTSGSCRRDAGVVPGTSNTYTYVLYPQNCAVDFAGADAG